MAGSLEGSRWGGLSGWRGNRASCLVPGRPTRGAAADQGVRPTWEFRMGVPLCVLRRLRDLARHELRLGEYHRGTEAPGKTKQCPFPSVFSANSVISADFLYFSVPLCLCGDILRSSPCA